MTSSNSPKQDVTSSDGIDLQNSRLATVRLQDGTGADDQEGIFEYHVTTTSLYDDENAHCFNAKYNENETLKTTAQNNRISQEGKKTCKPSLMSGSGRQRKIKAAVVVVACLLLLTSFILVGVTLSMSAHIDDMVRKQYDPSIVIPTTTTTTPATRTRSNKDNDIT